MHNLVNVQFYVTITEKGVIQYSITTTIVDLSLMPS